MNHKQREVGFRHRLGRLNGFKDSGQLRVPNEIVPNFIGTPTKLDTNQIG